MVQNQNSNQMVKTNNNINPKKFDIFQGQKNVGASLVNKKTRSFKIVVKASNDNKNTIIYLFF